MLFCKEKKKTQRDDKGRKTQQEIRKGSLQPAVKELALGRGSFSFLPCSVTKNPEILAQSRPIPHSQQATTLPDPHSARQHHNRRDNHHWDWEPPLRLCLFLSSPASAFFINISTRLPGTNRSNPQLELVLYSSCFQL